MTPQIRSSTVESQYDVVVVGHGVAGAAAAIEAADRGARVLIIDSAYGGGASALSGGVVYAGGGTSTQREAGIEDSPEAMLAYLSQEVGGAVSPSTLKRFCDESPAMIEWLKSHAVPFAGGIPSYKTSYPTDDYYLYYSGNESAYPYRDHARPAPRGHRVVAKGLASGKVLWNRLAAAAADRGVEFLPVARATSVVVDDGRVVGLRYQVLPRSARGARLHRVLSRGFGKIGNWMPMLSKPFTDIADGIFQRRSLTVQVRTPSVVLAAGGFIYNREWVAKYAPLFTEISPLGTPADDGSGIALGIAARGAVDYMSNVTAWRFLSPPSGLLNGVAVGMNGARIANEDLYGATLGDHLMRDHGGNGWAFYDADSWRAARQQIVPQTKAFQRLQAFPLFLLGAKRGRTLEQLASRTGVDPAGLLSTIKAYNSGIASGDGDPAHKAPAYSSPVATAPFVAINISAKNALYFPLPGLTLGGLKVDEQTGEVLRADGSIVNGLYAAGRSAVGVCSNAYISGLSLADGVFSGRRAGHHAAGGC